jgi:predicted membrane GTPase involved in stress response
MLKFNLIYLKKKKKKKKKKIIHKKGKSTGYALMMVEERGMLFVAPNEEIYEGMVIGENSKSGFLFLNLLFLFI